MAGYRTMFDEALLSIWSAPNYNYRCGNLAAIFELDENLNSLAKQFDASPNQKGEAAADEEALD